MESDHLLIIDLVLLGNFSVLLHMESYILAFLLTKSFLSQIIRSD